MKRFPVLFATAALALLAGCASIKFSTPGSLDGIRVLGAEGPCDRQVVVANYGYTLFWCIPLASTPTFKA